jgi:hypothetical protein
MLPASATPVDAGLLMTAQSDVASRWLRVLHIRPNLSQNQTPAANAPHMGPGESAPGGINVVVLF